MYDLGFIGRITMRTIMKKIFFTGCFLTALFLINENASSDSSITLTGIINGIGQIEVTDDETYDIEENEIGEELSMMDFQKVSVSGTVHEEDGRKILSAKSYKVFKEEFEEEFEKEFEEEFEN